MPNLSPEPNWKARAQSAESRLSEAVEALEEAQRFLEVEFGADIGKEGFEPEVAHWDIEHSKRAHSLSAQVRASLRNQGDS